MAQCPQPSGSTPAAPTRRSPSTAAQEAMLRRRLPPGPRRLRHTPPATRPRCLSPQAPATPSTATQQGQELTRDHGTAHALSLGMLVGITISLAIALVFQDLDSALMIMTVASILTIAYVVTRSPKSAPKEIVEPEVSTKERCNTSSTGPQNVLG